MASTSGTLAVALLLSCATVSATAASIDQALGKLTGSIKFSNVPSALNTYLCATPSASSPTGVQVYPAGSTSATATSGYSPVNTCAGGSEWTTATYEIYPPVDAAAGTAFLIEALITYAGGANYRFGFRSPGNPASYPSANVLPQSAAPAGTAHNLAECAAMADTVVRLSGAPADLDALDPAAPVSCRVDALVEEVAGSNTFTSQARSPSRSLTLATLRGAAGATISFPIRADGSRIKLRPGCTTKPPAGSNFAVDDAGLTSFSIEGTPATVTCGTTAGATLDLPVLRSAGALKGQFDISGYTESAAQVWAIPAASTVRRNAAPSSVPSNQPTPSTWRIDAIAAGETVVSAGASIQGGNLAIQLPKTDAPNQKALVPANGELDLRATFVVRPVETGGKLTLVDPGRRTLLGTLSNTPAVHWALTGTSYVEAFGDDSVAGAEPGSATGGVSRGRLQGSYSSTLSCLGLNPGCADLSYRLLLSGLSPVDGASDGSHSRRTAWDVRNAWLEFRRTTPFHSQNTTLSFNRDLHYYSESPPPAEIPLLAACMGSLELDLRVDAATGTLFQPTFNTQVTNVTAPSTALSSNYIRWSNTFANGPPQASPGSATATVTATVPEGARYVIRPQVNFVPAGGGAATVLTGLPTIALPGGSATLACSQASRACLRINDPGGNATPLTVAAGPLPTCQATGTNSIPVSVFSAGVDVDSITWSIDGGASTGAHCNNCGVDPTGTMTLPALGAGEHSLKVTASTLNGCVAETQLSICGTPGPSRRQLAFFDGNRLGLYRLEDGLPVFQVLPPGGAGQIRFNRAGNRLFVLAPSQLTVLDAATGALVSSQPGTLTALEFRPATADDLASVQFVSASGPYMLNTVLGGTPQAPIFIPNSTAASGETLSRPLLAWANDGKRLFAAYTRTSGAVIKLQVIEWSITGTSLGAAVSRLVDLAANEQLRAAGFEQIGTRFVFGTTRGVFVLNANGTVATWHDDVPINRIDIGRNPLFAFDIGTPPNPPPTNTTVFLREASMVVQEPAFGPVFGFAVSRYATDPAHALLAVSRSDPKLTPGQPIFVATYRLGLQAGKPALILIRRFPAQNPRFATFRPHAP